MYSRNGNKVRGLLNLTAIVIVNKAHVIVNKAHVGKQGLVFTRNHKAFTNDIIDSVGNVLIGTGKSKVINLAEEKHFDPTKSGRVNCMVLAGAFEVEFG